MQKLIIALSTAFCLSSCLSAPTSKPAELIESISFKYSTLKGLESEVGVCRRDPSDVIKVANTYYLYYTKTEKQYSGYDASIWFASSKDGIQWKEQGEALPRGNKGTWDAYSVFTPNILKADGKYYLYYTGVQATPNNPDGIFENNATNDITALGLAVASSPKGPFHRVSSQPILEISNNTDDFDSYRIDDASLIYRNQTYYLYYKGRSKKYGKDGPSHTKLGVAYSKSPKGPFTKYKNNPIISSGHEVMVWPYQDGLMTLLSHHGKEGKTLQYAKTPFDFKPLTRFGDDYPKAPGAYRSDDFTDLPAKATGLDWGISMHYGDQETWPYLMRFDVNYHYSN